MIQEYKNILLRDLCARMPYEVKCKYYDVYENCYEEGMVLGFERKEYIVIDGKCVIVEEVRPYLFPLSSMTDEQKKTLKVLCDWNDEEADAQSILVLYQKHFVMKSDVIDWLHKNHFDYRGLIEKGLAIDATEKRVYEFKLIEK